MAPDVSAVAALAARGVEPWVVDFGAPEREEGGMRRTLDDHVRAVARSIERARALSGKDVHLCGYSQGGMFAYQAAAYLRSDGVRSVVTFGAPVDIHKSLPAVRPDLVGAFVRLLEPVVTRTLEKVEGLPGTLTSTGFKLLSTQKEIQQRLEFVSLLHDRAALERREVRRRFLGGEGFVAWPGPAFRAFVDEFIVHNRMLSGGFVVDGRTVTLADIRCPILAFFGTTDDMARPAAVRAIVDAAPHAYVEMRSVNAGHFGIVVGSRAAKTTWPDVAEWIHAREADPLPARRATAPAFDRDDLEGAEFDGELGLLVDAATDSVRAAWRRIGDVTSTATDAYDAIRYQEPRLRRLAGLGPRTRTSPGLALAERAAKSPDGVFFLWRDRAFTYRDADVRVSRVVKGLYASGVRSTDMVGVVMRSRPSLLSVVTALSRLGAVAVLAPPDAPDAELRGAFDTAGVRFVIADPDLGAPVAAALARDVHVLGGGRDRRSLGPGLIDMEAIDVDAVKLPDDLPLDAGEARDLAMILLRPGVKGLRAARVTNHRWALSALGAAGACTIKPGDTVYCCIPLHHPTGIMASVGGALAGGARLALADGFEPARFFTDVRRCGATVVFYAGDLPSLLLATPAGPGDRTLPVRLFAGSGMRRHLVEKMKARFGAPMMEFYASTTHKVVLAEPSGDKPGALGRALPGSVPVRLVRCSIAERGPLRGASGLLQPALPGEPALLVARALPGDSAEGAIVVRDAFQKGDTWFVSSDVLESDTGGAYWFVDSLSSFVEVMGSFVSTRRIEDKLYELAEVELAAAWGEGGGIDARIVAAVVAKRPIRPAALDALFAGSPLAERPARVAELAHIPLTDGFRPRKTATAELAARAKRVLWLSEGGAYHDAAAMAGKHAVAAR